MTEDMRSPILSGKGASDYERYLRTDELLALQKPAEEMLHPDELTFQEMLAYNMLVPPAVRQMALGRPAHDAAVLRAAYPKDAEGRSIFPFRRIFGVAKVPDTAATGAEPPGLA